jgi:hypothetical protein
MVGPRLTPRHFKSIEFDYLLVIELLGRDNKQSNPRLILSSCLQQASRRTLRILQQVVAGTVSKGPRSETPGPPADPGSYLDFMKMHLHPQDGDRGRPEEIGVAWRRFLWLRRKWLVQLCLRFTQFRMRGYT